MGQPSVPIPPLAFLLSLPPETLGYHYARHVQDRGLQPLRFGPRRVQVHDVLHVLTGYDTDLVGEAQVQGFVLGCKPLPINRVLALGLLMRTGAVIAVWQAYQRGQRSTFNPDTFPLETSWSVAVADLKRQYGLA
ncbi:MAG: hypothetical protein OHK0012_11460 [Synechococcales cyanobacterium]